MLDAHLHLDQYSPEEIDRFIEQWRNAGVEGVVAVSKDLESSYRTLELKQQYPDFIYAAVGHHPEYPPPDESDSNELLALIECEREQISAIGEVGLPHYSLEKWGEESLEKHRALLSSFMHTAKELDLPLALHAVHDKVQPVLDMLLAEKIERAHFHWLKADADTLQRVFDSGYFLSVTPEVCYRERDKELARLAPFEQLLVETDGPWPFSGPFEGIPTTPMFLKDVIHKIAELKNCPESKVAEQMVKNTKKIYGSR
ncbi:MAG TPA: TatD family hydrolase [Bacillales bacterium]|nr:TatD family hydrolase [Bacillales bacterium]